MSTQKVKTEKKADCDSCKGIGRTHSKKAGSYESFPCFICNGTGKVKETETDKVNKP